MKIIQVDNFNRELVDDILICENINEFYGKFVVEQLNQKFSSETSSAYYKLVDDNYVLHVFEP